MIIVISIIMQLAIFFTLNMVNYEQQKSIMNAVERHISDTVEQRLASTQKIINRFCRNIDVLTLFESEDVYEKKEILNGIARQTDLLGASSDEVFYIAAFDKSQNEYKLMNNASAQDMVQMKNICNDFRTAAEKVGDTDMLGYCDFFQYNNYNAGELYICSVMPVFKYDFEKLEDIDVGTIIVACKINTQKLFLEIGNISKIEINITNRYTGKTNLLSFERDGVFEANERKNDHTLSIANTIWDISETWQIDDDYKLKILQYIFLLESLLLIFSILLMKNMFKRLFISPLGEIVEFLNEYDMVSKSKYIDVKGSSEINIITKNINILTNNIHKMTRRLMNNQQRLYEAEIININTKAYALQNQVNPHFLCNVMECMRGIALQNDLQEVAEASLSISEMMRYILEMNEVTSLENEIEIIQKYVNVMHIRYPGMFEFYVDIPDELRKSQIIKMTVQPIVENSFINGRFFRKKDGILKIGAYKENNDLIIYVSDNGVGFSDERKTEIEKNLRETPLTSAMQKGIGITNVNSRIRVKWGDEYGVKIFSEEGRGSKIVIRMPLKEN